MGEAKRRRDAAEHAFANGIPVPRPTQCPGCGSKNIHIAEGPELWKRTACTDEVGVCRDCRAVWEPFGATYVQDEVCAEPCDNCAFRPGSPEQADKKRWRDLLDSLKPEPDELGFRGVFFCHKNVPIDMNKGPGNFLFPQKTLDAGTLLELGQEGPVVDMPDTTKMRTCSGFLRMIWSLGRDR